MNTMLLVITVVSLVMAAGLGDDRVAGSPRPTGAGATTASPRWPPPPASPTPPALAVDLASSAAPRAASTRSRHPRCRTRQVALAGDRFLAADASGSGSATRQYWLMGRATFAPCSSSRSRRSSRCVGARRQAAETTVASPRSNWWRWPTSAPTAPSTVSGLVRNPAAGARVDQLEAEVRVFDPAGHPDRHPRRAGRLRSSWRRVRNRRSPSRSARPPPRRATG